MAPGGPEVGPYNMYFKNTGSIAGKVKVQMSYANKTDATTDKLAKKMVITSAVLDDQLEHRELYWGNQLIALAGDEATALSNGDIVRNTDGIVNVDDNDLQNVQPTIYGLSKLTSYFGPVEPGIEMTWEPGISHVEGITLMLDKSAGNDVQGLSLNVSVTATMNQVADGEYLKW